MRPTLALVGLVVAALTGLLLAGPALADSLSVGVRTDSVSLGINIGSPPRLAVVPGTTVYQAPSMPYNYFAYSGKYYLFHHGMWLSAAHYNGPWTVVALERVPRPILGVPVDYYKSPPGHWKRHGPPPWAEAKGHEKHGRGDHGKGNHGKGEHGKEEHGKKEHGKRK